jgi:hypothetical protein
MQGFLYTFEMYFYIFEDYLIKGLGSVSINIGPVRTRKLKFRHFSWLELFVQYPQCIEVTFVNIEYKTGAIFRIFLTFTEFHMFRH